MKKILFIGNSFTYFNAMPAMVQAMADAAAEEAEIRMVAYGGYFLRQHTDPEDAHYGEALGLLKEPWDVVVLQEQSKTPAVAPEIFAEGVAGLLPAIRACGAKPLFYMTWPYRQGSTKLKESGMEYGEMQVKLDTGYAKQMKLAGADGVAVGDAFVRLQTCLPYFNPYREDCYHPNAAGSYIAACLFFKALFGKEAPSPAEYVPAGLDASFAALLRSNL